MSEIAAFLLLAFAEDSGKNSSDPHLKLLLAESGMEASVYIMFDQLLKIKLKEEYKFETKNTIKKNEIPINKRVHFMMKRLMKHVEPKLFSHLSDLKFEPMICCIKWIRLMFLREFQFDQCLIVWDYIFLNIDKKATVIDVKALSRPKTPIAEKEDSFDVLDWLCVAVLVHLKSKLMSCKTFIDIVTSVQNLPKIENISTILSNAINAESNFISSIQRICGGD